MCELCEEQPAAVLCAECCKCYCGRCSEFVHGLPQKKSHKTEAIPKGVRVDARCPLHKDEPLKLFNLARTELCCPTCKMNDAYSEDDVVDLCEINKDNEIFSAKQIKEDFTYALKCDHTSEKKITDALEFIQKESTDTKEKVSQTFKEAHNKLEAEEAVVMEELEKACSKAEEALQKVLEKFRTVHEYSTVLNEANSKTEGKRSRLMELSIACEMDKQSMAMEELRSLMAVSLSFKWDTKKRKLSFIKHLINGAPVPNGVAVSNVCSTSANVSWSCEEKEDLSEEDKKKIAYSVEVKKVTETDMEWREVQREGQEVQCEWT